MRSMEEYEFSAGLIGEVSESAKLMVESLDNRLWIRSIMDPEPDEPALERRNELEVLVGCVPVDSIAGLLIDRRAFESVLVGFLVSTGSGCSAIVVVVVSGASLGVAAFLLLLSLAMLTILCWCMGFVAGCTQRCVICLSSVPRAIGYKASIPMTSASKDDPFGAECWNMKDAKKKLLLLGQARQWS